VRVRCYLHDDTHAAEGWYPPAERVLEFSKPFYWSWAPRGCAAIALDRRRDSVCPGHPGSSAMHLRRPYSQGWKAVRPASPAADKL